MYYSLGQQAQPQASPANKSIYYYERSGSNSPQIPYLMQRDHLASDSLVQNASASSKYVNIMSGGNGGGGHVSYHMASSSLPVQHSLPPKFMAQSQPHHHHQQQSLRNIQSPSKDYVQINPPQNIYVSAGQQQQQSQNSSPSRSLNRAYSHQSPTKSIGSAGSRSALNTDDINGSDYVCMSGGTLTKKLQQVNSSTCNNTAGNQQNQVSTTQVVFQRPPPVVPPLTNISLKTNYTTPANELPQAQYSTEADQQIDAIAVAKQSVNLNKISNSPTINKSSSSSSSSPTPSTTGSGKSMV